MHEDKSYNKCNKYFMTKIQKTFSFRNAEHAITALYNLNWDVDHIILRKSLPVQWMQPFLSVVLVNDAVSFFDYSSKNTLNSVKSNCT